MSGAASMATGAGRTVIVPTPNTPRNGVSVVSGPKDDRTSCTTASPSKRTTRWVGRKYRVIRSADGSAVGSNGRSPPAAPAIIGASALPVL